MVCEAGQAGRRDITLRCVVPCQTGPAIIAWYEVQKSSQAISDKVPVFSALPGALICGITHACEMGLIRRTMGCLSIHLSCARSWMVGKCCAPETGAVSVEWAAEHSDSSSPASGSSRRIIRMVRSPGNSMGRYARPWRQPLGFQQGGRWRVAKDWTMGHSKVGDRLDVVGDSMLHCACFDILYIHAWGIRTPKWS